MKKRFFLCVFVMIVLAGCMSKTLPSPSSRTINAVENPFVLDINPEQFGGIDAVTEHDVVYSSFNELNGVNYYRYHIPTGESVLLGQINNFQIASGSMAYLDNNLYFYVRTTSKTVCFYRIDLDSNQLIQISSDTSGQSLSYMAATENKILATKGEYLDSSESNAISYIEEFIPEDNQRKTLVEFQINRNGKSGSIIYNITYYNGKIYTLLVESGTPKLAVYDNNGTLLKTYNMNAYADILGQLVDQFIIVDNYLFISNFDNRSIVLKLKDNEWIVTEQSEEKDIRASYSAFGSLGQRIFYTPLSNQLYLLDKKSGTLQELDFKEKLDGYYISGIFQDNKNNFVITLRPNPEVQSREAPKKILRINWSDLTSFPTS